MRLRALLFIGLIACKKEETTNLKTLDHLVDGSTKFYACHGDFALSSGERIKVENATPAEERELRIALSSVPSKLRGDLFFDQGLFFRFLSASEMNSRFRNVSGSKVDDENLFSFWSREEGGVIFVQSGMPIEKLRYAVVRSVGQVYASFSLNREMGPTGPVEIPVYGVPEQNAMKAKIAQRIVLYARSKLAARSDQDFATQFGLTPDLAKAASLGPTELQNAWLQLDVPRARVFADAALAELFQSWYCLPETNQYLVANGLDDLFVDLDRGLGDGRLLATYRPVAKSNKISSARIDYFGMNAATIQKRREVGLDLGAEANRMLSAKYPLPIQSNDRAFAVTGIGDFLQILLGFLIGGFLGNSGGAMGCPNGVNSAFNNPFNSPIGGNSLFNSNGLANGNGLGNGMGNGLGNVGAGGSGGMDADSMTVVQIHNQHRQSKGLPALTPSPTLAMECQQQAAAQVSCAWGPQCHTLNGFGTSRAENIARGQSSGSEVAQSWIQSKGHRDNIELTDIRNIGVAKSGVDWCERFN